MDLLKQIIEGQKTFGAALLNGIRPALPSNPFISPAGGAESFMSRLFSPPSSSASPMPSAAPMPSALGQSAEIDPLALLLDQSNDSYDKLLRQLRGDRVDPGALAGEARAAFDPAIAALREEMSDKKGRFKKNKKELRQIYNEMQDEDYQQARQVVKAKTKAVERSNKETMRAVGKTQQEYNREIAQQVSEMEQLGMGESAQAIARQELERQAMEAQTMQEQQGRNERSDIRSQGRGQRDFFRAMGNVAPREGQEMIGISRQNLEEGLTALAKELAGIQSQAGQAAFQARQAGRSNNISLINARAGLQQNRLRDAMAIMGLAGEGQEDSMPKNRIEANQWAASEIGADKAGVLQDIWSRKELNGKDRLQGGEALKFFVTEAAKAGVPEAVADIWYYAATKK